MDDNTRMRVEFPLGTDLKIIVLEPTPAQMLAISLSRKPGSQDKMEQIRLVRRLFSVIENLVTQEVWDDVIEAALISGTLDESALMAFVSDILGFNWSAHRDQQSEPVPDLMAEPEPPRPAPRVISGG